MDIIESMLTEQIASLQATEAMYLRQRADALAAAEASSVQAAGAKARAAEVESALEDYLAQLQPLPSP